MAPQVLLWPSGGKVSQCSQPLSRRLHRVDHRHDAGLHGLGMGKALPGGYDSAEVIGKV